MGQLCTQSLPFSSSASIFVAARCGILPYVSCIFFTYLFSFYFFAVGLPKALGALCALPEGGIEGTGMPPTPGRPPPQKKRKPGRKKTKLSGPWGQKGTLGTQASQPGKELESIKIPKKRGPKPGSKV